LIFFQKQSKIINPSKIGKIMAITDIQISEELQTGAPSIKYRGNEGPKAPMEMAMSDPMLIEEYEKYVYTMKEQGQEPVSFEQFVQEIMSGMAKGGRAGYGLGSLVRSITRPIKKLAKSDLGKAGLTAAGIYGLGGGFGSGFKFGNLPGAGFFGKGSFNPMLRKVGGDFAQSKFGSMLSGFPGGISGAALTASSLLPMTGFGMGDEETIDFDLKNIPDSQKFASDYSQMRKDIGDAIASGVKENFTEVLNKYNLTEGVNINFWEDIRKPSAQGGRIGKAGDLTTDEIVPLLNPGLTFNQGGRVPAREGGIMDLGGMEKDYRETGGFVDLGAKEKGGIMDLGGMEKDYRNTGGFVDLGAKEKADDVPARLSVNEFVFTADAVRNAGGGDIDQGAKVMENIMKHLEAGGQVSEESQGMQGARDMFATSQRLSEVV
jgi:hypothetical protein